MAGLGLPGTPPGDQERPGLVTAVLEGDSRVFRNVTGFAKTRKLPRHFLSRQSEGVWGANEGPGEGADEKPNQVAVFV